MLEGPAGCGAYHGQLLGRPAHPEEAGHVAALGVVLPAPLSLCGDRARERGAQLQPRAGSRACPPQGPPPWCHLTLQAVGVELDVALAAAGGFHDHLDAVPLDAGQGLGAAAGGCGRRRGAQRVRGGSPGPRGDRPRPLVLTALGHELRRDAHLEGGEDGRVVAGDDVVGAAWRGTGTLGDSSGSTRLSPSPVPVPLTVGVADQVGLGVRLPEDAVAPRGDVDPHLGGEEQPARVASPARAAFPQGAALGTHPRGLELLPDVAVPGAPLIPVGGGEGDVTLSWGWRHRGDMGTAPPAVPKALCSRGDAALGGSRCTPTSPRFLASRTEPCRHRHVPEGAPGQRVPGCHQRAPCTHGTAGTPCSSPAPG